MCDFGCDLANTWYFFWVGFASGCEVRWFHIIFVFTWFPTQQNWANRKKHDIFCSRSGFGCCTKGIESCSAIVMITPQQIVGAPLSQHASRPFGANVGSTTVYRTFAHRLPQRKMPALAPAEVPAALPWVLRRGAFSLPGRPRDRAGPTGIVKRGGGYSAPSGIRHKPDR